MTIEEKAKQLAQKYFSDEKNIWARSNYEAKTAEYACIDIAQWLKEQINKSVIETSLYKDGDFLTVNTDFSEFGYKEDDKIKLIIMDEYMGIIEPRKATGVLNEMLVEEIKERTKRELIDKACVWLKSYRQDTPDGTGYITGIVNDKTIEDFHKAMEE